MVPHGSIDIGDVECAARIELEGQDPAKLGVSGFRLPVLTAMTADFAARAAEAAEFLRNTSLPNPLVSQMLAWKDENNASADETAAWLLTNHTDVVMNVAAPTQKPS